MQKLAKDKRIKDAALPNRLVVQSIEPALIYANETPDFATISAILDEGPSDNEQDDPEISKQKERGLKDASTCHQDICSHDSPYSQGSSGKITQPNLFPTLPLQPYNMTAIQHGETLLPLSGKTGWKELGLEGSCSYNPTAAESNSIKNIKSSRQALKSWLKDTLDITF
ncbi:hypothetical protein N7447_002283 [Penicillium robsamsonii]|uniref:uncharacterized protein n=1 Tax=Penicillium robsamsonii TaxID=1792511 RepID=UPI002547E89B|nr:uncharacterized protein N7447_002283 [Penicillium robsamsonii]KAJ5836257.1 hypothetical protein N7447_002283 [Penicillium robsamsonii]